MSSTDPIITRIVIRRNQSLSWHGLAMFLAGGFAINLVLALAAGVGAGWWPVVGFEASVFVLLAAVQCFLTANRWREVVTVHERTITVEYGRRRAETRIEMDRYWARLEICVLPRPALILRSRGTAVEIARALDDGARGELAARLRELIGPNAMLPAATMTRPMPSGRI